MSRLFFLTLIAQGLIEVAFIRNLPPLAVGEVKDARSLSFHHESLLLTLPQGVDCGLHITHHDRNMPLLSVYPYFYTRL